MGESEYTLTREGTSGRGSSISKEAARSERVVHSLRKNLARLKSWRLGESGGGQCTVGWRFVCWSEELALDPVGTGIP